MTEPNHEAVISAMREQLWTRLGLVLDEFYTAAELATRWIEYRLERGDAPSQIAEALVVYMHEKHDLEWIVAETTLPLPCLGARADC